MNSKNIKSSSQAKIDSFTNKNKSSKNLPAPYHDSQQNSINQKIREKKTVSTAQKEDPQEIVNKITNLIENNYHMFGDWEDAFDHILDLIL